MGEGGALGSASPAKLSTPPARSPEGCSYARGPSRRAVGRVNDAAHC